MTKLGGSLRDGSDLKAKQGDSLKAFVRAGENVYTVHVYVCMCICVCVCDVGGSAQHC